MLQCHEYGMLHNSLLKLDRPSFLCFDHISDPSKEGFLDLIASKVINDFRLQ